MEKFTLRASRAQRDMSMRTMAEIMGVTRSQISKWETGASDMSTAQLCRWAEAVGMEPQDIFLPIVAK